MINIESAIAGKTPDAGGEIRADCPNCEGGQRDTLGVNVNSGVYSCFRCELKGNYLKVNGSSKKSLAQFLYDQASPAASHPYIERKQIKPQDIRVDRHGNWIVPFTDSRGNIQTIQFIKPEKNRGKRIKYS